MGKKKNKEGKKEKRGSPSFKSFIRKYEKNLGACKFLNSRLYTMLHPPSLYINPVAPVFHRFTASCSLNKPYCKRRWSRNPFSVTIEQRDGVGGEASRDIIKKKAATISRRMGLPSKRKFPSPELFDSFDERETEIEIYNWKSREIFSSSDHDRRTSSSSVMLSALSLCTPSPFFFFFTKPLPGTG